MGAAWSDQEIAELRALRAEGVPYRQVAQLLGRTRDSVFQAAHRYIFGNPARGGKNYARNTTRPLGHPKHWSEAYLTERYADRKKRQGRALGCGTSDQAGAEA